MDYPSLNIMTNGKINSFFLSNLFIPTILNESTIRFYLMARSNGESHAKDGLKLTSRSQGFKSESTSTSNPNISKQFVL